MLSPANAELVRRDAALPGLAMLLDPQAFLAKLRASFPDAGFVDARPTYIRYKPGTNCLVLYDADIGGRIVHVHAKTFGADAAVKFDKSRHRRQAQSIIGTGRTVAEDISTIIQVFPNDHDLTALRDLGDQSSRERLLRNLFKGQPELWGGTLHDLQYKPERRYVARLDAHASTMAVLKFYTPLRYPAAKAIAVARLESRGQLRLPSLCAAADDNHVLAYAWEAGVPMNEIVADGDADWALLARVGAALATLHGQQPKHLPIRKRGLEFAHLQRQVMMIEAICPQLAAWTAGIVTHISRRLAHVPVDLRPVHGDCNDKQILLSGDAITVLDLDQAAAGDAAYDLGLFIAHLERYTLSGALSAGQRDRLTGALLHGYGQATARPLPRHIAIYTAYGLVQLAVEPFRTATPDWPVRIEAMLNRADALLGWNATASLERTIAFMQEG